MKVFKIPVEWIMSGTVTAKGNNLEEATQYVDEHLDDYPIPENGEYIDESFHRSVDPDFEFTKYLNGIK